MTVSPKLCEGLKNTTCLKQTMHMSIMENVHQKFDEKRVKFKQN